MRLNLSVCLTIALLCTRAGAQTPAAGHAEQVNQAQLMLLSADLRREWQQRATAGLIPAVITEPSLTAAAILTPSIDVTKAPGAPEISLSLASGTVGIRSITISLTTPDGFHSYENGVGQPAYPPERAHETLRVQLGFGLGLYSAAGGWSISAIQVMANDGQTIFYSGSQLLALFKGASTITVANPGSPDTTPPIAGKGTILTPTVSLSSSAPFAAVKLPARDMNSGVTSLSAVFTGPTGQTYAAYLSGFSAAPASATNLTAFEQLQPTAATGTYTLAFFSICDAAGNCLSASTPADIAKYFSTTTFSVVP